MAQMQLLRRFISERLSAAAEEIFAAVQRTIREAEEEEEVQEQEEEEARSDRNQEQQGVKQEVQTHSGDTPQIFTCTHEQKHLGQQWSPDSCHNDPSVEQQEVCGLLEPAAIKQEQPWSSTEGQQDVEDADTSSLKVTPTYMKSCSYSDMTADTVSEDRKPAVDVSPDHREAEGDKRWTFLPDCSVTLNNMGPELGLATLTGYGIENVHTGMTNPSSPDTETRRRTKSYCCRFCGKQFSHGAHLATHTQTHTGEKLFFCKVCGKEFRHGNSVTVHMRIHTEEKPYRCRICGKEFRHVGNLNVHTRIHTGEKPYVCTLCGKKFSRNNLMKKHMAAHTSDMSLSVKSVLRRGSVGVTQPP